MARLPRLNLANIPQHIILRGNNRQICFFDEQDYKVYLAKLKEFSEKLLVAIHAYVLMTNHVHLLATPSDKTGVSRLIQRLGAYYVRYINKKYDRCGTLWQGRYKSTLVDNEGYFLTVSRYIEMNPVRANMVEHPAAYSWSSFHRNALGIPIELITPYEIYQSLGNTDQARQKSYLALFEQQISESTLKEIRESINHGWVLGNDRFKAQIEITTGRQTTSKLRGGDRKSRQYLHKQKNQML
ncbi:transposase [uncultured Paraglaciecola sp.]|uniref:transposase n=1 Tax=uncultured Paraglaciecola sp. TaxID=1765024 RepID=UPI00262B8DEC|nr:transposase [uncultured Paraglaciecola sp.]